VRLRVKAALALVRRLSNTFTADFCVKAPEEAMWCDGTHEIFNPDNSRAKKKRVARFQ